MKKIYDKYKDQITKLVGISKDYNKDYVYLMSNTKKKIEDISTELKVWTNININEYYNNDYRSNKWINYDNLIEKTEKEPELIKEYCSDCGRKLTDNQCVIHGIVKYPVDKNDPVVIEFKKLEKEFEKTKPEEIEEPKWDQALKEYEKETEKPVEPLIAVKEKTEKEIEKTIDIYADRLSICKPKGVPYNKNKWTNDMEKINDKLHKQSEKDSKKALLKAANLDGFVFFIVHSEKSVNVDNNIVENIITELLPKNYVLIAWFRIKFEKWVAQTVKKA